MGKVKDTISSGAKQFSKWATKKTGTNIYRNLTSPYNEPRAVKYAPQTGPGEALAKGAYEAYVKPAAQTVKMTGQAIGKGLGRLAYGKMAERPASVKPNVKRKK